MKIFKNVRWMVIGLMACFFSWGSVSGATRYLSDSDFITIDGRIDSDGAGLEIAGVGDVNGDGFNDIAVSATYDSSGTDSGVVALFFGKTTVDWADSTLDDADVIIAGEASGDDFGEVVVGGGDVDGDGMDDLVISAPDKDDGGSNAGKVYVVFGTTSWTSGEISITSLAHASFVGETAGDQAGYSVSIAGNYDGDGYNDLAIGAPYYDNVTSDMGIVYLFLGSGSGSWSTGVLVSSADANYTASGCTGCIALGAADQDNNEIGISLDFSDLDQDGYDDLVVGRPGYTTNYSTHTAYTPGQVVIFGGNSAGTFSASDSVSYTSGSNTMYNGKMIAAIGDSSGDGYPDFLASFGSGGSYAGVVAACQGDSSFSAIGVDSLLSSPYSTYASTVKVAGNGDLNADGLGDFFVRTGGYDGSYVYQTNSYLVYGVSGGWSSSELLSDGVEFIPESGDSVPIGKIIGDVDGDGADDLLVGVSDHDASSFTDNGRAYLVLSSTLECENEVPNPSADDGLTNWTRYGGARVSTLGGDPHFVLLGDGAYLDQDISIPSGTTHVFIGADVRALRSTTTEGYPYLLIYVMDSGGSILDTVRVGPSTSTSWTTISTEIDSLDSSATTLRVFLRRTSVSGYRDLNRALFDDVTVSFDCSD